MLLSSCKLRNTKKSLTRKNAKIKSYQLLDDFETLKYVLVAKTIKSCKSKFKGHWFVSHQRYFATKHWFVGHPTEWESLRQKQYNITSMQLYKVQVVLRCNIPKHEPMPVCYQKFKAYASEYCSNLLWLL